MLNSISGYNFNKPTFKQNLHPVDLKYKQALIRGVQTKFQFTPRIEALEPILAPQEFKNILKRIPEYFFKVGDLAKENEFVKNIENIKNKLFRINLHTHTVNSDGNLTSEKFLEQSKMYADKIAENKKDSFPAYISSVTDHNNFKSSQEVVAMIADDPAKYKNYKFVVGCEYLFEDKNRGMFEALAYGFDPFDEYIEAKTTKYNSLTLIEKLKEYDGVLSYAHPLRYCQGIDITQEFIDYIKNNGVDGMESHYQYIGINHDKDFLEDISCIKKIAKENNFIETGGTDSHVSNIFCFQAEEFLDDILK